MESRRLSVLMVLGPWQALEHFLAHQVSFKLLEIFLLNINSENLNNAADKRKRHKNVWSTVLPFTFQHMWTIISQWSSYPGTSSPPGFITFSIAPYNRTEIGSCEEGEEDLMNVVQSPGALNIILPAEPERPGSRRRGSSKPRLLSKSQKVTS